MSKKIIKKVYPTIWGQAEEVLKKDGVVVLPTDTLYGIVACAKSKKAVAKIYKIKDRTENKPFIILISSYKDLEIFGVKIENDEQKKFLKEIWPGKVSIIFPCNLDKWSYLHRGTYSIAFRMIGQKNKNLFNLINKIGPIVAPSANIESQNPAETIMQAKKYFGKNVDLYINGGKRGLKASTLIKFKDNNFIVLRQGGVIVK